jgi:hypothetical protein
VPLVVAVLSLSVGVVLCAGVATAAIRMSATTSFSSASEHSFTVPCGVFGMDVTAVGAAGGSGRVLPNDAGGQGASVTAFVPVSPGEQLSIGVGAPGAGTSSRRQTPGGAGGTGGADSGQNAGNIAEGACGGGWGRQQPAEHTSGRRALPEMNGAPDSGLTCGVTF